MQRAARRSRRRRLGPVPGEETRRCAAAVAGTPAQPAARPPGNRAEVSSGSAPATSAGRGPRALLVERPPPARAQRLLRGSRVAVSLPVVEGVCRSRELRGAGPPRDWLIAAEGAQAGRGEPLCGVEGSRSAGLQQQSSPHRPLRRIQIYRYEIFFVPPTCCKKANGTDISVFWWRNILL